MTFKITLVLKNGITKELEYTWLDVNCIEDAEDYVLECMNNESNIFILRGDHRSDFFIKNDISFISVEKMNPLNGKKLKFYKNSNC